MLLYSHQKKICITLSMNAYTIQNKFATMTSLTCCKLKLGNLRNKNYTAN